MTQNKIRNRFLCSAALAWSLAAFAPVAMAQDGDTEAEASGEDLKLERVVSIGSRVPSRSALDTPAPVDVIPGDEFVNQGTNDVSDILRTAVPSYNVNTQPISDAATIIRPANVRALSPDNVLVLLNGKRRHRGSVISFLGGGISDGAQGADVSVIPSLALSRVEVLRDGASSQYGSDAIAGVINFQLREDNSGGTLEAVYGSTYEGDGDNYRIAGNIGLPLTDRGFLNLTGEISDTDGTVRSIVRGDVEALIAAGNTAVADFQTINTYTDQVPQYWGQPDVKDNYKLFFNSGIELSDSAEIYAFGNYAERTVEGGFFFRNPTNRGGVYRGPLVDPVTGAADPNGVASILVGDLDGVGTGGSCPAGIPLTQGGGLIADPTVLAQVTGDANCFSFVETIPSGFVPRFGGDNTDYSLSGGIRGAFDIGSGLNYDFSVVHGSSKSEFFIRNTINASLGPNTPRDFNPGAYQQTETIVDADFSYSLPVSGLASDLNIAFGTQYREEEFEITAGDPASFQLGPLADQGFSSSSNGFGGFTSSSTSTQDSVAFYVDLEADVTDQLTMQGALRYEDYDAFGDTTDYKLGALYRVTDNFRLRGTISSGFHAPTAGQANVTNVTTQNVNGVLIDQGTLPLASAAGQLAADFIEARDGGRPELGTESAENFTIGAAFDVGAMTWTVDYFNIAVEDRIALSANVDFLDALDFIGNQSGLGPFTTVSDGLTQLGNANVINRNDFVGFEDLTQFRYFTNSFDTTTSGVEVVGTLPLELTETGDSKATLSFAYIDTKVDDAGSINPISAGRVAALEELLPELKGSLTLSHIEPKWRVLTRANYYGEWEDTGNGTGEQDAEINIDAEFGYYLTDKVELILGANNIFDNYPNENPNAASLGQLYPESAPAGFNGGSYYLKARYTW
ncbi:MAG: TonB-dependent receptor [Henriciella sp.]|jgi:iron complex outermembrane receptor protein